MNERVTISTPVLLVLLVSLGGCGSTPVKQLKQAAIKEAIEVPMGMAAKPLLFKRVVVRLPRGRRIGSVRTGRMCSHEGPLTWRGGGVDLSNGELTEVFREELEKANYPLAGNPDALFDDPTESKAELLIAGLVKRIEANICYPKASAANYSEAMGETFLRVQWQVFSRLDRRVVFTATTEGSSSLATPSTSGYRELFLDAFGVATQNLLAERKFHDLVVNTVADDQLSSVQPLSLERSVLSTREIAEIVNDVRAAVVTVFAGDGHGSGFFVDDNGLLVTNSHVVENARFVKIKLVTGRELLGEVLRVDRRRDVALIAVEEGKMSVLPIRFTAANIGEEVYAIGSPLDEKWNTTISKGIVSGHRLEDGMEYIQSDVNVLPGNSGGPLVDAHGNLIGLTVSGVTLRGSPAGVNFFIPIHDALETLNLRLANGE